MDSPLAEVAAGQAVEEERVVDHRRETDAGTAGTADLDAPLDRTQQARDMELREPGELLLRRANEHLLARDTEEVGVGVPVAHEVERLLAAQPLVTGLEVDRRVATRPRVVVEVAAGGHPLDPPHGVYHL